MARKSQKLREGMARFEEVYPISANQDPTDFEKDLYEHLFGEIWQRPGLSVRDRRLMVLGIAAAQGNESILRLQFRAGLAKGDLRPEDLQEITLFLTQYVGWPLGTRVNAMAREASQQPTAGRRG